jgi:hypothetical protein
MSLRLNSAVAIAFCVVGHTGGGCD